MSLGFSRLSAPEHLTKSKAAGGQPAFDDACHRQGGRRRTLLRSPVVVLQATFLPFGLTTSLAAEAAFIVAEVAAATFDSTMSAACLVALLNVS